MNRKLIIRVLGAILLVEAVAMIPSLIIALFYPVFLYIDLQTGLKRDTIPIEGGTHLRRFDL